MLVYLAPDLATRGLALDGLVYANIAVALANGEGSFWALPYYTDGVKVWSEHPPLGIWLESLWFAALGAAFWVEKAWSVVLMLAVVALVAAIWRDITARQAAWWPLALLFLMPVATQTFRNNYLEITLTAVALAGIWAARTAIRKPGWLAVTALAAFVGVLIKGPVGLLPVVAPAVFGAVRGSSVRGLVMSALCLGAVAGGIGVLALVPDAGRALATYWDTQVRASLAGERPAVHGRAWLLGVIALNLAVPCALAAAARWRFPATGRIRECVAWLAMGLAATAPLLLSPRQFRHYLLPALPLYAIGLALIAAPRLPGLPWRAVAAVLIGVAASSAAWHWEKIGEDVAEIEAAHLIASVSGGEPVGFCQEADPHYFVKAYLYRYERIESHAAAPTDRFVACATSPGAGFEVRVGLPNDLKVWHNRYPSHQDQTLPP